MKKVAFAVLAMLVGCGRSQLPAATFSTNAAPASYAHHRTFRYVGKKQHFKVPPNVTAIFVIAIGGEGGGNTTSRGGRVSAVLPVTGGELLYVRVGGNGTSTAGGYNGGGEPGSLRGRSYAFGGGGASDIRQGGDATSDRVLVVGGGGGQGGGANTFRGITYGVGGKGGGTTGGSGNAGSDGYGCTGSAAPDSRGYGGCGGTGGTQTTGGVGGLGGEGDLCFGASGSSGTLGRGGAGGAGVTTSSGSYGFCGGLGGGGGGGYYGGGGGGEAGGSSSTYDDGGAGGGGGSSYVESGAMKVHMWQGWNKNEFGLIVLSW